MKKLLSLMLALLLTMNLAWAENTYSPAVQAEKLAIRTMYEKYGFTLETVGVFTVLSAEKDGAWYVSFQCCYLPYSRLGQYDAIVTGEDVQLAWTHDSTTEDYTAGDPACAVWGAKQIEAYLAVDYTRRHKWIAPYFAEGEQYHAVTDDVWAELGLVRIPEDEVPRLPDDLRTAANAAVKDVFGMTDEQFAIFERAERDMAVAPDGVKYFFLTYPSQDMCIQLLMNAETAEIMDITLMSGGNG